MRRLIYLLLLIPVLASGQEQIIPLGSNAILKAAALQRRNSALQRTAVNDTLILPFIDDFSRQGIYPYEGLWTDSNVFINNNYSPLPVTIGIATFDGLTKDGVPYNPSATSDSIADVLTSKPIDMAAVAGDTSIWLSFFYQPQGLGDVPETKDSLILELKDSSNTWNQVWSVPGRTDTVFQRVNIHVLDGKYFYKGFQFRFYNIATINGNRDHWHLDYVILRQFGAANDPIVDIALIHPQTSLLSEYSAMPYNHYKFLGTQTLSAMRTDLLDTLYNLDYSPFSFNSGADISQNGTSIFSQSQGPTSMPSPHSYLGYTFPLNSFVFPSQSVDSVDFLVKTFVSQTGTASNVYNDTSYFTQHFHNYYAYDDGSAEVAYALTGNTEIEMAYKFDVKMRDTLVGVQIYFNPVGVNVTNKLFQLCAWSNVDVSGNSASLIYKRPDQKCGTNDSINGFRTYTFDSTIIVDPGPIWVGILQNEPATQYGVGLDRNTDSHTKMFYHVDGFWYQSSVAGSWMIRPLFGSHVNAIGVDEINKNTFSFTLYPNPANESFTISCPLTGNYHFELTDITGRILKTDVVKDAEKIDVSNFTKGIYLIRLTDSKGNSSVQKLLIQ